MGPRKLLQGHLLLDSSRRLLRLELLIDVYLSFHVSVALEREAVPPQVDLSERMAVLYVPGSLCLEPGFKHWGEVFLQSVLCQANLCDLVLSCKSLEEGHCSIITDFTGVELETGEERTPSPVDFLSDSFHASVCDLVM